MAVGRNRLWQLDIQVPCVQCCGVEKEGGTFCSLIPSSPPPHTHNSRSSGWLGLSFPTCEKRECQGPVSFIAGGTGSG